MSYSLKFCFLERKHGKVTDKKVLIDSNEIGYFTGDVEEGKMSGSGVLTINKNNPRILTGIFKEGVLTSGEIKICVDTNQNSFQIFEGEFSHIDENDKPDGIGTIQWKDTSVYHGEFVRGEKNGRGTIIQKKYLNRGQDPVKIEGVFKDGYPSGKCSALYSNGTTYEGEFGEYGKRQGYGICRYKTGAHRLNDGNIYSSGRNYKGDDGFVYEGEWNNNQRQGVGILKDKEGVVIAEGVWEANKLKRGFLIATDGFYDEDVTKIFGNSHFDHDTIPIGFEGEVENFTMFGYGKMVFPNGAIYKGEWSYNKRNGQGQFFFTDFATYEGNWKRNKRDGQGKFIFPDGASYHGEFDKNAFHGKGVLADAQGVVLAEGEWENNKLKSGVILTKNDCYSYDMFERQEGNYFADGLKFGVYEGQIENFYPHGKGKLTLPDDSVLEGEFYEGFIKGIGTMVWPDLTKYEGEFDGFCPHGQGIMSWTDGDVYCGEFVDGERHGKGKLKFEDGAVYIGDFIHNKREGQGNQHYADGTIYEGGWKEDAWHGQGTFDYSDGNIYVGECQLNERHGHGTHNFADGTKYEGGWINDIRNGKGILTDKKGSVLEQGFWADDECITTKVNDFVKENNFDLAIDAYNKLLSKKEFKQLSSSLNQEISKLEALKKEHSLNEILSDFKQGNNDGNKDDFDDFE
jgi:hypothetical protein